MNMSVKRARTEITLERKYEIVCFQEQNKSMKQKDIALHFDVKVQTLSDILKNKERIIDKYLTELNSGKMKRMKKAKFEQTSKALLEWFSAMQTDQPNIQISGEILRQKATGFAKALNEIADDGKVDIQWINRWKANHDISSKKLCGENSEISENATLHWKNVSAEIMNKYLPQNILNCDECGLFWRLTPDKALDVTPETMHDTKQAKERITVLNCVSMSGEKYPLFVVGKFTSPRCFKNVRNIPVTYHANSKARMTSDLFYEYLMSLDQKMKSQNRKVALILDRCPAHSRSIFNLTNVALYFLPPKTTSDTQPLVAGIINSMKSIYRGKLVQRLLVSYEKEADFQFSLLDALNLLNEAWEAVPENTIVNCFRQVGFVDATDPDELTPVTELEDPEPFVVIYERLREYMPIPMHAHFDEFVNVDNNLSLTAGLSDMELLEPITSTLSDELNDQDNGDDDAEAVSIPTHKEAVQALQTLQHFLMTHSGFNESYLQVVKNINDEVLYQMSKAGGQPEVTEFFHDGEWSILKKKVDRRQSRLF